MAVRVTRFAGEFAELAAWTGESEAQLRADEDYHAEDRDHWLAWDGPGIVGVLAAHRRRGLARALIAQALAPLADDGETRVTAEADTTNAASDALLRGFGATVTGGTIELRRPAAGQRGR
jgi:GNAT superfamily N-acetyltransferase